MLRRFDYQIDQFIIKTICLLSHHFDKNDERVKKKIEDNLQREFALKQDSRYN